MDNKDLKKQLNTTLIASAKKVLKNESNDYHRHISKKRSHELSLEELSQVELVQLSHLPDYNSVILEVICKKH